MTKMVTFSNLSWMQLDAATRLQVGRALKALSHALDDPLDGSPCHHPLQLGTRPYMTCNQLKEAALFVEVLDIIT